MLAKHMSKDSPDSCHEAVWWHKGPIIEPVDLAQFPTPALEFRQAINASTGFPRHYNVIVLVATGFQLPAGNHNSARAICLSLWYSVGGSHWCIRDDARGGLLAGYLFRLIIVKGCWSDR